MRNPKILLFDLDGTLETKNFIESARKICGMDCEITVDTLEAHYWNYKTDPKEQDKSWGDSIYTDFTDFKHEAMRYWRGNGKCSTRGQRHCR